MSTKTYRGKEIAQLMSEIKQNHGDDATIVSTRELDQKLIEVCVGLATPAAPIKEEKIGLQALEKSEPSPHIKSRVLSSLLQDQGISAALFAKLSESFEQRKEKGEKLGGRLAASLQDIFSINSKMPGRARAVALVGPTGVGKTTTIAKLAARMRMAFDISIALISADCYRVGAGFHLQSYASLINLPFRALDPRFSAITQLSTALEEFKNCDLILIDTAGYSPRRPDQIKQLADNLLPFPDVERILVLPAPSNSKDLATAVKSFRQTNYERLIISKLDETGYMGPVLNGAFEADVPLAFLTTGQRVPEDIEPASFKRLAWMLKRTLH